jgi:hypothetical protein
MTEDTRLSDIAVQWVEALTARGVTLQARGKNIAYSPKSAYAQLTNDERATAKAHKADIVALLRAQYDGTARALPSSGTAGPAREALAPTPAPAPPPEPCPWCNRAPCVGPEHEHYDILHPHAPPKPTYDLAELYRSGDGLVCPDAPFTSGPTKERE